MPNEIDIVAERLLNFSVAYHAAKPELDRIHNTDLTAGEIEDALVDLMGIEKRLDLMNFDFDKDRILDLLKGYDFNRVRPQIIEIIRFRKSILPKDLRMLREEIIKDGGEIWEIHKNDADPFPSNPHAHNRENGYKLDLSSGILYMRTRPIKQLPVKNLLRVRSKVKRIALPNLQLK